MHWSSEWAEQHYDITSSTSPPAHSKPFSHPQPSHPGFSGYSDDISALGASTLLKRYAERYSFTPAYTEPGAFRRRDTSQGDWPLGHNPERLSELDGVKGSLESANCLTEQFSPGSITQEYTSAYSGPHLYPKPTYLPQSAFDLPPAYPSPAAGYAYVPCLTAPSSPCPLPSGVHAATPLSTSLPSNHGRRPFKRPGDVQEHPRNRRSGHDPSSARASPYVIGAKSDHQRSEVTRNSSADLHILTTDRFPPMSSLKGEHLQPFEINSYAGPEQYPYP